MTPEGVHEQKAGRVLLSSVGVVGGGGDGLATWRKLTAMGEEMPGENLVPPKE